MLAAVARSRVQCSAAQCIAHESADSFTLRHPADLLRSGSQSLEEPECGSGASVGFGLHRIGRGRRDHWRKVRGRRDHQRKVRGLLHDLEFEIYRHDRITYIRKICKQINKLFL